MTSRAACLTAIATVGSALGELADQIVFVGGTVVALYPLEGGADVRPTVDVDCVVNITTTSDYYAFVQVLRTRGFKECTDDGAPLCRHVCMGVRVDVMPTADTAIGPSNRYYADAMREAATHEVNGVQIRAITPAYFVATKLEAFRNRGSGDFVASHDIEDLLAVLGGIPSLRQVIADGTAGVETALRNELAMLAANESFVDALPGHFEGDAKGQRLASEINRWLRTLSDGGEQP
jgi:hypothetical protein